MKQVFLEIIGRVDALQLRERAMLLFAGVLILFLLFDTFGLQPGYKKQQQKKSAIVELEHKLQILRERTGLLAGQSGKDMSAWRDQLQTDLAGLENRLHRELGAMLAPEQAMHVLEQVLTEEKDLKLMEVDAFSEPLNSMELSQKDTAAASSIGRYGLQLHLEGSYLSTLRYLLALESLPWTFFWEGVDFEVIEYPNARVKLDIYTLGLLEG